MNDGNEGAYRDRLAVPETAGRMTAAAAAWLATLTGTQRDRACFAFGEERRGWSFLPARERDGLPIGALGADQRRLAHELIATGTSLPGYTKVVSVMAMEHVLRALRPAAADLFDPERYCVKVFGTPGAPAWGWQLAGHHVSLNFTIAGGIAASALDQRQLDGLGALVGAFARRLPDEVAGAQLHDLERAGMDNLVFAWAGSTEPGQRHYFRIQGPKLLIEHDNTRGNGNHIHSVWRNPADDFGDDVLAEHYRLHHHGT